MITKKVVLVLGAGASLPYGFPTGSELTDELCGLPFIGPRTNQFKDLLGDQGQLFELFAERLRISGEYSVDAFLSKQPTWKSDLVDIGKEAIAYFLSSREREADLFVLPSKNSEDWYRYLWVTLSTGAHNPEDFAKNNLKIITFNYDRSLEAFLHQKITYSYGITGIAAMDVLHSIPISHVYGDLLAFGVATAEGVRTYEPIHTRQLLKKAAESIQPMYSARTSTQAATYTNWFEEADVICFLGFGFDSTNIERLGISNALKNRFTWDGAHQRHVGRPLQVFMTARGISQNRISKIISKMGMSGINPAELCAISYGMNRPNGSPDITSTILDELVSWDCFG